MHPTGLSARWRGWTTRAERERSCSSSDLRRVAPIGCAAAPCHSPATATHRGVGYGTTTSAWTAGRRPRAPVLARRRVRADARNRAERVRFGVDTGVPVCSECVGKGSGMMIDRSKRLRCVTRAMHMCNNMVEVFGRVRPRDSRACAAAPCDSPATAKHRGVGYGTTTSARTAGRRPRAPVLARRRVRAERAVVAGVLWQGFAAAPRPCSRLLRPPCPPTVPTRAVGCGIAAESEFMGREGVNLGLNEHV